MNHADFGLGTWHPEKGMHSVVKEQELSRRIWGFIWDKPNVQKIIVNRKRAVGIVVNGEENIVMS